MRNSLRLWLKANEGGTSWSDQSGHSVNVTLGGTVTSGSPLNYNRTNYFEGSGYYNTNLDVSAGTYPYLFVTSVYVPSSNSAGALWGEGDGQNTNRRGDRATFDYNNGSGKWNNTIGGGEFVFDVDNLFVKDVPTISTVIFNEDEPNGSSAYINGKQEIRFTSNHSPGTSNPFEIGRVGYDNSKQFKGRVGEVLVYSGKPSRNRIESYLAIKYGITLDQTTAQSYVNSSGTEIYDADGVFNAFDNNIIGIGQDNANSLDQRISKSINAGSVLILSNDADFASSNIDESRTPLGNGNFLVTGHNGGSVAFAETFANTLSMRMSRVWAFDETGTVDNVHVAIRTSDVAVPEGKDLHVIISADQTFDDSDTVIPMTNDGKYWSAEINPDDGYFMNFAYIQGPGGVSSGIVAWLKSEEGTNTTIDGGDVTAWNNSMPNTVYNLQHIPSIFLENGFDGNLVNAISIPPSYESDADNLLNFHPTVLFEGSGNNEIERLFVPDVDDAVAALKAQTIKGSTVYVIGRPKESSTETNDFWSSFGLRENPKTSNHVPFHLSGGFLNFYEFDNNHGEGQFITTNIRWSNDEIALVKMTVTDEILADVTYNKNGGVGRTLNSVNVSEGHYHVLGNWAGAEFTSTDHPFGNIAETIIYSSGSISEIDNLKIESYLALKYGITLDQTTPKSYINSKGTEIYDADGAFDGFDHDIIGIGQDDRSSLDQRISKSVNDDGSILILSNNSDFTSVNMDDGRASLGDGNFLVTGHNGGSIAFTEPFARTSNASMARVWAFDETGDVGNVHIAILTTDITVPGDHLYAVTSKDQTFNRLEHIAIMENDGTYWSGNINPGDGYYMTFVEKLPAPGDVSNNIVTWLKSENGISTITDGGDVTSWKNSVPNPVYNLEHIPSITIEYYSPHYYTNETSTTTSVPPSYENDADNLLNFHPSVLFEFDLASGKRERLFVRDVDDPSEALKAQTVRGSTQYAIGRPNNNRGHHFWTGFQHDRNHRGVYGPSTLQVFNNDIQFFEHNDDWEYERFSTGLTWNNGEIALLKVTIPDAPIADVTYNKNGGIDYIINDVDLNGRYHVLGNWGSDLNQEPFGNIAETIIYNSASISSTESSKIESYLALKYGITLDQTTAQSYVNSEGTVIYDAEGAFDDFDNNIIGIGQDEKSSLDQRISKSINAGSVLILSNDADFASSNIDESRAPLGDGNFLVTGHNGNSVAFTETFANTLSIRMPRVWAFDETGTVDNVYVAIRTSDVDIPEGYDLHAVISADQTFDDSDVVIPMTNDGEYWSAEINTDDGNFMSFISIQGPGGVSSGIVAWLKSDSGTSTTTDGEDVTSWRNSAFNPIYNLEHNASVNINISGNASTLTSVPPSYETDRRNMLNFAPTVLFKNNFDGIGERLFISDINESALEAQTIGGSTLYAVGSSPSNSGFFWSGIDNDELPVFSQSVLLVSSEKISFNEIRSDRSGERTDTRVIRTSLRWDDGEKALVKVTVMGDDNGDISYSKNGGTGNEITASIRNGYYHVLGNSSASIIPFGNVAETIIYDTPSLSEEDNAKIESYLALKYGITLDQTIPQSYVNSEGTEIYDSDGAFDDFDHHIIGIGKDDGSSLDQRISKSVHLSSFLTLASNNDFTSLNMSKGRTSLGDGNFFVMGHNGGTIAFEGSFEGEENTLINRVWAIDKTGDFGDVYVSFMRSFSIPAHLRKLYVVLSRDQTFDGSDRVIRMTSERSNWVAKINPRDGDFMTFVSTDADFQLDLYIKDSPDDIGEEPNLITKKFWRSPDIWVRNNPDGREEHQNPVYKRNNPNYVYVRIRNRSNVASTGEDDEVKLYWKKAGAISRWAQGWYGSVNFDNGAPGSGPVGTVTIPVIEPGEEVILEFPWQVPNPNDYVDITSNQWHFCFLARIVSERDPMMDEREERYTTTNTKRNNNIAWNNVTVVKSSSNKKKNAKQSNFRSFGGTISVGNPFNEAKTFSIELIKEESETGKAIFDEAKVSLEMNQTLYNAWKRGGNQSELLKNTNDKKKKLVKGNHARLENLRFAPNEMGTLNVSFNFLAKELTDKSEFVYHVVQKEAETGEIIGGETYVINKDLQVETEGSVKEDRKLEINNKMISIGKTSFDKIIPNPASNTVRFTYNLGGAKSAYLTVTGFYNGATRTSNNYILDSNSTETTLDLTNYSGGHYQVTLVCDGKIVEAKTLIKE